MYIINHRGSLQPQQFSEYPSEGFTTTALQNYFVPFMAAGHPNTDIQWLQLLLYTI